MGTSDKLDAPLPATQRRTLAKMVETLGERAVLAALRLTRHTLGRCMAGLPVRAGTRALVERALEQRGAA